MPTLLIPISDINAYLAFAKQSVGGTSVTPTYFPRWDDGSTFAVETKTEEIWEGDGSRHLSQIIKNGQEVKAKLISYLRPVELGFFEQLANGLSSDTYTGPTVSTTLNGATLAGATTIAVHTNTGLTGSGTKTLIIDPGLSTEEIATFTTPPTGGSDPYTLTVVSSGTLKFAHSDAAVVKTNASHVLIDAYDGPYATMEVCLGGLHALAGETIRVRDCKVDAWKVIGEKGKLLQYEIDFIGIACVVQNAPLTVTLENRQPFIFYSAAFTLNGSTSGDALGIFKFTLERKNNLDDQIQTTAVTPAAIIFAKHDTKVMADLIMQSMALYNLMYFGSTTGTSDSSSIGAGSITILFAPPDGFHTLQYSVTTMHYSLVKPPAMKTDGKHYEMSIEASGVSNNGLNASIVTTTLQNAQYSAYN